MSAEEIWGKRWRSCAHPLTHRFMEISTRKKSLVILAADLYTIDELVNLIDTVGPYPSHFRWKSKSLKPSAEPR